MRSRGEGRDDESDWCGVGRACGSDRAKVSTGGGGNGVRNADGLGSRGKEEQ